MILVHATLPSSIEDIKKHGLVSSKKIISTMLVAEYQNKYRPKFFPAFMDMKKCIYFYCSQDTKIISRLYVQDVKYVQVRSQDLDPQKLYVARKNDSDTIARVIAKVINTYRSGQSITMNDNELIEISKSNSYKEYLKDKSNCIKDYWNSIIPFKQYEIERNAMSWREKIMNHSLETEILYFGDISHNNIDSVKDFISMNDWFDEDIANGFSI